MPSTMIRSADDRNKLRHSANRLKEWLHDLASYEAKRKLNSNALAPPYPFSATLPDNPFRKEILEIKDEEEEVSIQWLVFSNLIIRFADMCSLGTAYCGYESGRQVSNSRCRPQRHSNYTECYAS